MQAVILAAGESSRFWPLNKKNKCLIKLMGHPLIYWMIKGLKEAGIKNIVIVQGPKKDVEEELGIQEGIKYIVSPKAKGMGSAISAAKDCLDDNFFVLGGERVDAGDFVKDIVEKKKIADAVVLGARTETPELYGIMDLEGDKVKSIIEKPAKEKASSNIRAASMYFLSKKFMDYYEKTERNTYDFEDALNLYMKENDLKVLIAATDLPTLKYPWHLFGNVKYLMNKNLKNEKGRSVSIAKNAYIEGNVCIGSNVKILEGAAIKGPAYIGDNVVIGNNSLVREYSNLEKDCVVGALCEVARSVFQDNVHVHSGFFGDSIIARNCRFGAGTITANVRGDKEEVQSTVKGDKIGTGLNSLGSVIGENTKTGINCSLMPGVMVGFGCLIGPASLVLENVEDNVKLYSKSEAVKKKLDKGSGA